MEAIITAETTANRENEKIEKIVINMLQRCKFEAEVNTLQIPLEDIEDRVSYYTGIPKIAVNQIQKIKKPEKNTRTHFIDLNTRIIIFKCLFLFYERKELPTFGLLFKNVNKLIATVQDAEQFKQDVTLLGLEYQTIFNNTKLLMEDPKITFERYSYLKKIKELRKKQDTLIYYINERIIDKDQNFNTPWNQNIQASNTTDDEYIFFHAITKYSFTNGLFCFNATEDDFYKWVVDILLGSLRPSSVVVLDNSPLHGTSKSKSITMFDTKHDMQKWLQKHNVPCSDTMNKSQLYELIKKHALIEEMYRVDRVIKANGHEVLRLPTHCENLSPIECIWQDIKGVPFSPDDIHDEILSKFVNMPIEDYHKYEKNIEERENEIFSLDTDMDKVLENFLLDLKKRESGITFT